MSKQKKPGRRNPIAYDLAATPKYKMRVVPNDESKARKRDTLSRDAKHKKSPLDESHAPVTLAEFYNTDVDAYQVGDKVDVMKGPLRKVLDRANKLAAQKKSDKGVEPGDSKPKTKEEEHAIVREPHGPAGTIGITIDGEYHLVDEEDVKLICEAMHGDFEDLHEWSYAETTAGIRVPISSEEQEVLSRCGEPFYKSNMDDREQEVARRMVSRGVLHRHKDGEGIYFVQDNKKLTRF
jgi:hypothetical protein